MFFRTLIVVTLQFFWFATTPANASAKCLESAADFQKQSAELPKPFDNLPLFLSVDAGIFGKAAIQVRTAGDKLKLVSYVSAAGETYGNESYIQKVCFDGPKVDVILESNVEQKGASRKSKADHDILLKGDRVQVDGHSFSNCSEAEFRRIAAAIEKKIETQKQSAPSNSSEGSM